MQASSTRRLTPAQMNKLFQLDQETLYRFEERAAILEFENGLSRDEAEFEAATLEGLL
jgi:hypothetical protein